MMAFFDDSMSSRSLSDEVWYALPRTETVVKSVVVEEPQLTHAEKIYKQREEFVREILIDHDDSLIDHIINKFVNTRLDQGFDTLKALIRVEIYRLKRVNKYDPAVAMG